MAIWNTVKKHVSYIFPADVHSYEEFVRCLSSGEYERIKISLIRKYGSAPLEDRLNSQTSIQWGAKVVAYGTKGAIYYAPIFVSYEQFLQDRYFASERECNLQIDLLQGRLRTQFPLISIEIIGLLDRLPLNQRRIDQVK